jgi:hypothetical protein
MVEAQEELLDTQGHVPQPKKGAFKLTLRVKVMLLYPVKFFLGLKFRHYA